MRLISNVKYRDSDGLSLDGATPGSFQKFENGCGILSEILTARDNTHRFIYSSTRAHNVYAAKLFDCDLEHLVELSPFCDICFLEDSFRTSRRDGIFSNQV